MNMLIDSLRVTNIIVFFITNKYMHYYDKHIIQLRMGVSGKERKDAMNYFFK